MYFSVLQRAMVYLQQQREAGVGDDDLDLSLQVNETPCLGGDEKECSIG
jgi:hypothetical protein